MKQDDQKGAAETYVGLMDPASIRKPLLEAAKASVETQRQYERIRALQEEKLALRSDLARSLKEMRDELSKVQMLLPAREVKEAAPAPTSAPKKKVIDHRIDKIEGALAEIENRLKTL